MGIARGLRRLDLLKRWGVIWEYVIEEGDVEDDLRVTIWLTGRGSEPVEDVLSSILDIVPRERLHVVRERPPVITSDADGSLWSPVSNWRTHSAALIVPCEQVVHDDHDREAERPPRD